MMPEGERQPTPQAPFQRAFDLPDLAPPHQPPTQDAAPINTWAQTPGEELLLSPLKLPMVPNGLKQSFLAQQLPEGRIIDVTPGHIHEARRLDRHDNWNPVIERGREVHDDPYKRGGRKLAGVVIEIPDGITKGQLPNSLVASAGSWIRQSEDPANPHLGGVFVVWPKGEYVPTKKEILKMFKDANLVADESQEPVMYEAQLDDGRKVWIAQARTWKKKEVPEWVKAGYRRGQKPPELPEPNSTIAHPEILCGDCNKHAAVGHVEIVERRSGRYLIERIICESGLHRGGDPEIDNKLIKTLARYTEKPSTPRPKSSQDRPNRP